ncbi:lysophospholipid acyltransferase family protein [Shumkonia mesophila]|uniref:lysophospholipid acyltransferase family protein n=1 Tax=Shumkonia mesophila TaxID=2838854 RepID=UPI0029342503|nr:lysophospholipid acyltransferase family protein [Shumkonia mesophila]
MGRFALFLLMTAVLVALYGLASPFGRRWRKALMRLWFKGACRLTALDVRVTGTPWRDGPVLMVANHVSYLDVPVLGSLLDVVFVAKEDVAAWPLFGFLARLVRTAFISRRPAEARRQARCLGERLRRGETLLAFPEGTSTAGFAVRPFKTALFAVAEDGPALWVQPVSIAYPRAAAGKALTHGLENLYAWYGEMTLLPHLFTVFGLKGAEVEVIFHEPVAASAFADRKDLARHCREVVSQGLSMATGRWHAAIPAHPGAAENAEPDVDLPDLEPAAA